ncbi:RbsD/FucU family protein [Brucellaceae bacterium D45D]
MLKNINPLLTGSLLSVLADMGHGDDLVIVDANYPAEASGVLVLDFPGISATAMTEAVLSLLPLDDFVDKPAAVMQAPNETPAIFSEFETIIETAEGRRIAVDPIERFAFYERAREAFAIIRTGERRLYGNVILKKGVIRS